MPTEKHAGIMPSPKRFPYLSNLSKKGFVTIFHGKKKVALSMFQSKHLDCLDAPFQCCNVRMGEVVV